MTGAKRTCVIGIGSPSGDDQAGWLVIDALLDKQPPDVDLVKLDRPGNLLISLFEKVDKVILIDAMQRGGVPGEVRRVAEDEWTHVEGELTSHGLGVFDALKLARELNLLPADLALYGIEAGSVKPGDVPGNATKNAAEKLAERLVMELTMPTD